jgi:type II secretory pathway pseudopilin PulG
MDKKDIALTIGGILAVAVVGYLMYQRQQTDAANAAAANQAAVDAAAQAEQTAQYSNEYQYSNSMPSISIPSIGASQVDTSASTASNGTTASNDQTNLLTQIIGTFADSINASPTTGSNAATMIIPTVIGTDGNTSLSGIPTTAQEALDESGVSPGSTVPVQNTTSTLHNSYIPLSDTVHYDHIVNTGA